MSEEEIKQILREINWDTPLTTDDYYRVFTGEISEYKGLTLRDIYIKLWKARYFHDLYKLLGEERLKE